MSIGGYPFPKRDMYNNIDDMEEYEVFSEEEDDVDTDGL